MSNPPTPPPSTATQIPYHMSEAEIRYRIIVLLEAVERLKKFRQPWMPFDLPEVVDSVVDAVEFLKQSK